MANKVVESRVLLGVIIAVTSMIFGLASCGSGGSGGAILSAVTPVLTVSLVPARTSGVAPLAVFFDASGTTDAGVTSRPFHDIEYRWDFGDPASGATWANGAQPGVSSKNSATGPVAAHVFETPGTYNVALTVFDGINTATRNTTITVTAPDTVFSGANTICFSTSGTFTGCPGTMHITTSDFATAISTYQGPTKRLLFRRGEIFSVGAGASPNINTTGPGIVGAFGAGTPPPVIRATADISMLNMSSSTTPGISDWRIMDLMFDGQGGLNTVGIDTQGGMNQLTILRISATAVRVGVSNSDSLLDHWNNNASPSVHGHTIWDQWAIVDSTISNGVGSHYGTYLAGDRLFFAGNLIDNNSSGSHATRFTYLGKSVISSNTLSRAGGTEHSIKLHAPAWQIFTGNTHSNTTIDGIANTDNYSSGLAISGAGIPASTTISSVTNSTTLVISQAATATASGVSFTVPLNNTEKNGLGAGYTRWVIISDNKLIGANNAWTVVLGPENGSSDQRVKDVIVERNWLTAGAGTQSSIVVFAVDTTVRNNLCDMTSALYHQCIGVSKRGVEPPSSNVRVYNNTFYSGSLGDFTGVNIDAAATNVTVINNLGSAPLATRPIMISGTGASGLVQSNNLLSNVPANLFVNLTPVTPVDFKLKALPNLARDQGLSTVPVFSDFFLASRPQSGVPDVGAVEGP